MRSLAWAASLPYQGVAQITQRRRSTWPRLPRPTISVGNLAFGGRGKTPITAAIALEAQAMGLRPGILIRGYGGTLRASSSPQVLRGTSGEAWLQPVAAQRALCGEEACWLAARCPGVPVGVHGDRARAARELLRQEDVDLLILDDGFQAKVCRDLDLILLDAALDPPFTTRATALRESVVALRRVHFAGVFGLASAPPQELPAPLGQLSTTLLHRQFGALRSLADGSLVPTSQHPERVLVAAAVGQPATVVELLASQGIETGGAVSLRDHCKPTSRQMSLLRASQLPVLVTEKDAVGWAADALPNALVMSQKIVGVDLLARRVLGGLER